MDFAIHQGKLLNDILETKNIKKTEFAEMMDMKRGRIHDLIKRENFEKQTLCLVCTLLDIPPEKFGAPKNYFNNKKISETEIEFDRVAG